MRRIAANLIAWAIATAMATAAAQTNETPVVEAVARGHHFELSTQEVPSGWTTFRLDNQGDEVHFMVIELLPDGKTLEDSLTEVVPQFQEAMSLINVGDTEAGLAKLGELPEWFNDVQFTGGPGLVSPGLQTEVTVRLEPGTYVVECYVKDENGEFHSYHGMIEQLIVTGEESGAPEPTARQTIRLSNSGIDAPAVLAPGRQIIAVEFEEHQPPPAFGNDLHIVRLEDRMNVEEVAIWMDWAHPQGLRSPEPARFMGGTHELPVGNTAYLTVDLEPGSYAFISETSPAFGMWSEFTVDEGGQAADGDGTN